MGCFTDMSRTILFIINAGCFLIGAAMIAIGTIYLLDFTDFIERLEEFSTLLRLVPILLIIIGGIIFCISFLGCCGAFTRSSCMLTSYAVALIVILVLQIAFVIYTFVQVGDTSGWKSRQHSALENLFNDMSEVALEAVNFIQETLECCGLDGPPSPFPESCCKGDSCFIVGCNEALYEFLTESMNIIGIVAATLAAVELVGAVLAFLISRKNNF